MRWSDKPKLLSQGTNRQSNYCAIVLYERWASATLVSLNLSPCKDFAWAATASGRGEKSRKHPKKERNNREKKMVMR